MYNIIRFYKDEREKEIILSGLTLKEAKNHCNNPNTSTDEYFEGFSEA